MFKKIFFLAANVFMNSAVLGANLLNSNCKIAINAVENNTQATVLIAGARITAKNKLYQNIPFVAFGDTHADIVTRRYKFPTEALQIVVQNKKWRLWFDETGIYRVLEASNDDLSYEDAPNRVISSQELCERFAKSQIANKELIAYLCLLISKDDNLDIKQLPYWNEVKQLSSKR